VEPKVLLCRSRKVARGWRKKRRKERQRDTENEFGVLGNSNEMRDRIPGLKKKRKYISG